MITKDEEGNLTRCLRSVSWAQEVIIVDCGSRDRTVDIARQGGARVMVHDWTGYGDQKNFGIEQATQPWVLSLDADEVVSPELAQEVQATVANPEYSAYRMFRPTYFMGRPLGHYGRGEEPGTIRLFRRGTGRFNGRLVHELVTVDGPVGTLRGALLHYSYPTVKSYRAKIHHYASLEAQERALHGSPYGGRWFRGFGKLAWMLVVKRGLIDGPHAWLWIAGQAYQEWLATGEAARLRRQRALHVTV